MEFALARFGGECLHRVRDRGGVGHLKALDVVERHVAERALVPVAAARELELDPASVAPETVHGVRRLGEVDVLREVKSAVGGTHERGHVGLQSEQVAPRTVAFVVHHHVEERPHARVVERAELRVHVAAAEDEAYVRREPPHGAGDAERAEECAGEGTRHANRRGLRFAEGAGDALFEDAVDGAAPAETAQQRAEVGHGGAEAFGVAGEAEVGVDLVADGGGEVVEVEGAEHLRAVLRIGTEHVRARESRAGGCEGVEGGAFGEIAGFGERFGVVGRTSLKEGDHLVRERLFTVGAQDIQRDYDGEVALCGRYAERRQPADELRRGRVGRVELHERRRQKEDFIFRHNTLVSLDRITGLSGLTRL